MGVAELREPILYAEEMWQRQRFWVVSFILLGAVAGGYQLWLQHGAVDFNSLIFVAYVPAAALWAGFFLIYRQRWRMEITDEGVRIATLLGGVAIKYDNIRSVRIHSLDRHFQAANRRRYLRPAARSLLPKSAVYLRLRGEQGELELIQRKLGRTLVEGDVIAVPVAHPQAVLEAINSHLLPWERQNLGGQRRGRRQR